MTLSLHNLKSKSGSKKGKKRIGRGLASKGTYSGRGVKGQRARSGGRSGLKLKGIRKIVLSTPKLRGFKHSVEKVEIVNLDVLSKNFGEGSKIGLKQLTAKGLITAPSASVKILGKGNVSVKWTVEGCSVSQSAKEKIEKAGGTVIGS